jgi:nicotinamidase-related amidase
VDALLIVDLQRASFATNDKHDQPATLARVDQLAHHVRTGGGSVIFVLHDGDETEDLVPNSEGWQLVPSVHRDPADHVVRKTLNDAFAGTTLAPLLDELAPDRLIICGWATDLCVDSSVRSAVTRGYRVVVPSDAHTVTDRPHLAAAQVIAHHNWLWTNLITPDEPVRVVPTANLISAPARA